MNALLDDPFLVHLSPGTYTISARDFGHQPQAMVKTALLALSDSGQHPVFDWTIDGQPVW